MKINYVSDLHLEGGLNKEFTLPGGDILLLVGDIIVIKKMISNYQGYFDCVDPFNRILAPQFNKYKNVYAILGNHEHYHGEFTNTLNLYRNLTKKYKNFQILNNKVIELKPGLKLFGGTLWTDYNGGNVEAKIIASQYLNDHRLISYKNNGYFTPDHAEKINIKTTKLIFNLVNNSEDKWIIMTHHSPSMKGCHPRYGIDNLNYAFHNTNLDDWIRKHPQIKVMVHGHTHDSCDYYIGDTHVLCNPKGYGNENKQFDPKKQFEI